CGDDTTSEMSLPDSVHQHAGGQRMVWLRQPECQRSSPLRNQRSGGSLFNHLVLAAQGGWECWFDSLTFVPIISTDQEINIWHYFGVSQYRCRGHRFERLKVGRANLLHQFVISLLFGRNHFGEDFFFLDPVDCLLELGSQFLLLDGARPLGNIKSFHYLF